MRKNKLYIFLSILTIIFLFGTAAICTQCGASIDKAIGDLGDNVDEEPTGTEPGGEQPSGTEPGETPPEPEPGEEPEPELEPEPEPEPEEEAEEPEEEETKEKILGVVPDETGCIGLRNLSAGQTADYSGDVYAGHWGSYDIYDNGYISFDITALAGLKVVSATLTMDLYEEYGDRSPLGNLRIGTLDYGTGPLIESDGNISANMLVQFPNSITDISYDGDELAEELQKKIDATSNRFQLKVYWSHPYTDEDTYEDDIDDGLRYQQEDIYLTVQYTE